MTNFDRHIESGRYRVWIGRCRCESGHSWTAEVFSEYGGVFFVDDDAAICPACKGDALDRIEEIHDERE